MLYYHSYFQLELESYSAIIAEVLYIEIWLDPGSDGLLSSVATLWL